MAGKGEINADLGINMNPAGMANVLSALNSQISAIITKLNEAGRKAEEAVNKSGKAGERAIKQAEQAAAGAARSLGRAFATLETARTANSRNLLGAFQQDQKIGKTAEAMARWVDSLNAGGTASANLTRRINANVQAFADMARRGDQVTAAQVRQQAALRASLSTYESINRAQRGMFEGIGKLSTENQAKLNPLLTQLSVLDRQLNSLTNRPNRVTFNVNLSEQARITAEIQKQIRELERQQMSEKKLADSIRERARALLAASNAQRASAFETGANRFATIGSATGNNPFANSAITIKTTDLAERLQRAIALSAVNMNALQQAYASGAAPSRLQTLIDRQERLNRLMQQAEGLARAQDRLGGQAGGGFMGGMRSSFTNLLGGEEGQGFGFGAGALVGRVASYAVAATAIYGLINAFRDGARFAVEFEDALARLQAISGATSSEMVNLSENILVVSRNSANSILEITQAATVLAQAGYTVQETTQLLQNVVNLAGTTGSSPSEAVDLLTSSLGAFQMNATEATHVTDALVSVLNQSKLSVNQVQLGLQYVGATARDSGVSFEELTGSLGAMADAGIRSGSTMSTGLRQMLIDLRDPSEKLKTELRNVGLTLAEVDVQTRGLIPVLRSLRDSGFNAYGTLETRAAAAYSVLSSNIENIERLRNATLEQNVAAEAQAQRLDTLSAQWNIFKNTLGETGTNLGSIFIPAARLLVKVLTEIAQLINSLGPLFQIFGLAVQGVGEVLDVLLAPVRLLTGLFELLGFSVRSQTDAMEQATTAYNEAKAAAQTQQETLNSLDQEIQTLRSRYVDLAESNDQLADGSNDLAFEIERLSQRFPELRNQLEGARQDAQAFLEAMYAVRQEVAQRLLTQRLEEQTALNAQVDARATTLEAKKNSLLFHTAPGVTRGHPEQVQYINALINSSRSSRAYQQAYEGLQALIRDESRNAAYRQDLARAVSEYIAARQQQDRDRDRQNTLGAQIGQSRYAASPFGRDRFQRVTEYRSVATSRIANLTNQSYEQKAPQLQALLQNAQNLLAVLQADVNRLTAAGQRGEAQEARRFVAYQQQTINTIRSAMDPTQQPGANRRGERPGALQLAEILRRELGITITPGQVVRSRQEQEVLYQRYLRGGNVAARPGTSPHERGQGIDISARYAHLLDRIVRIIEANGGRVTSITRPGLYSDGHRHINLAAGGDPTEYQRRQTADVDRARREAERARQDALRDEQRVLRETTEAAKSRVDILIRDLDSQEELNSVGERSNQLFDRFQEYEEARLAQAQQELRVQNITGARAEQYLQQINIQLDTEWRDTVRQAATKINSAFTEFVRERSRVLEEAFQNFVRPDRLAVSTIEGRIQGLDNPALAGRVPDYVRTVQERRLAESQQTLRETTFNANEERRAKMVADIEHLEAAFRRIPVPAITEQVRSDYEQNIRGMTAALNELDEEQNKFLASAQAINLIPQNWAQSINTAVEAWRIINNASLSIGERLRSGLGGALDSIHQSFQTFFSDIMSGTKSVGQAFGDMAKGIIKAMADMAAKAIATQIFNLILSVATNAMGGGNNSTSYFSSQAGAYAGGYRGGLFESTGRAPKGFSMGGYVSAGIPTRDTIPAMLSKGEFVMRRSSVEDVGHRMLADINNRGKGALQKLQGTQMVVAPPPPVTTNVYIIPPDEQPTLGPNDVIATWSRDVLNGGPTKQLIKQVARGG